MSGKLKKIGAPILIVSFFWFVWSYSSFGELSRSFIKLPELIPAYSWIFFVLLLVILLVFYENISRTSWLRVAVYSTATGYLISLLALVIAEFLITAGGERLHSSIQTVGLGAFLATQLVMTGICAGWLYGLLGALAIKSISKL